MIASGRRIVGSHFLSNGPLDRRTSTCQTALRRMAVTEPREPGRPRAVVRRRTARMQERVAAFHEAGMRFAESDRVVQAAAATNDLEALFVAREELAREAAGLLYARLQSVPGSREMGRLASRRIAALRDVANLTVAIARVDRGLPSPAQMGRILQSLQDVIEDAASVLPEDVARRFAAAWRQRIEPHLEHLRLGGASYSAVPSTGRVGAGASGEAPAEPGSTPP